jgi:hypothetical protein
MPTSGSEEKKIEKGKLLITLLTLDEAGVFTA